MLITSSSIIGWKDLQDKVAILFLEMGYEAVSPYTVQLSGRGKKEVDVYVRDPTASVEQITLIECKFWGHPVSQETVHAFHAVMVGAGANSGIIVSKAGFQSGAYQAASNTNINLLTWEQLQIRYGREWYMRQSGNTG